MTRSGEPVRRGLADHVGVGCRVLFVGLNPGLRSAAVGHHFAGYSNRFWRLMVEAGFLPAGFSAARDAELPQFGLGITNLVARPTPGVAELGPKDYAAGRPRLLRRIRLSRPGIVALVGIMVFRELAEARGPVACGLQPQLVAGIPCWVLPNPSGRNAHFSYATMLEEFRRLKEHADPSGRISEPLPSRTDA